MPRPSPSTGKNECPDCAGDLRPSRISGLAACSDCGQVFVHELPADPPEAGAITMVQSHNDIVVPDYTDVMIGWRGWDIKGPRSRPLLASVSKSHVWHPRQQMTATCDNRHHEVPEWKHSCGLYSAKSRNHLLSMGYNHYSEASPRVIGTVKLWGKIVEGSQGWRAEHGYPGTLYVPWEMWGLAEPLQELYGCDVELQDTLRKQVAREKRAIEDTDFRPIREEDRGEMVFNHEEAS